MFFNTSVHNICVHNVRLNWVNRESRDLRWRCGCLACLFTFIGASRGHVCDSTAFLFISLTQWSKSTSNSVSLDAGISSCDLRMDRFMSEIDRDMACPGALTLDVYRPGFTEDKLSCRLWSDLITEQRGWWINVTLSTSLMGEVGVLIWWSMECSSVDTIRHMYRTGRNLRVGLPRLKMDQICDQRKQSNDLSTTICSSDWECLV